MVKAKSSGSLFKDFLESYRGKLNFQRGIGIRLVLTTFALAFSAALLCTVSIWSDTFVKVGFYSDVCSEDNDYCLKQYVLVVVSVIGGNVYGVQCASFFTEFFNRHGGRGCVVAGSLCLVLGWIGILLLQQASRIPSLQFLLYSRNPFLQLAAMSTSIGTNLLCEGFFSFMAPTNGLQGLLLLLSGAGYGGGTAETFALRLFENRIGFGAQGMIPVQVFLSVISAILCFICIPSEAELKRYSSDAFEEEAVQEDDRLTMSEVRQLFQGASRMISLNWFRHLFFIVNMSVNTACAAMYQGLATKYGTLLFGSPKHGLILATISSGSAMLAVSGLAPVVSILMEHIGLRRLFITMTGLLWISRFCVLEANWFAQSFVAVTFALIWGLQPVVWGVHAYAYATLNRVATVILLFGVVYIVFFEFARNLMFRTFLAYESPNHLQSIQVLLYTANRLCIWTSTSYTLFFIMSGLPKSPVIFPDEEVEFCKQFACSNLEQLQPILNLKDTKSCHDMISLTSVPENHSLIVSRVREESLKYALSCNSASQIAELIETKSFVWQRQLKVRKGSSIGLFAPPSQWREVISDGGLHSKALSALKQEIAGGLSSMVVDSNNPDKVIRIVDIVVLRLLFRQIGLAGDAKDLVLIETGRPSHSGQVMEIFRFPGTKRQKQESVDAAAERLISWMGIEDVRLHIEFLPSEVSLESQESVNYPGLTTVYKKHYGDVEILDDCKGMKRIGLPTGLPWHRGGDPKDHHFGWFTVEDIEEHHPEILAGSNSSRGLRDGGVEAITGLFNISLKDLSQKERSRRMTARKHTSRLASLIRKREKVALKAELETGNIENLKEGFGAMPLWLGQETLSLYHKRLLEMLPWTELASMLRKRRQLRPVVMELLLHDLMSAKLARKKHMAREVS